MIQQIVTIGRNTFIEAIRQPIFSVLTCVAILFMVLNVALAAYTLEDDNKLLIDMGLSTLFLTGLLLAAFTATGVLSEEVENKTVLTVVSKPVARPVFVLGKFFGIAGAIALAYWILTVAMLLAVRHTVLDVAGKQFDMPVLIFGVGALAIAVTLATVGNYFYHWVFTSSLMLSLALLSAIAWVLVLLFNRHWQFQPPTADLHPQLMIGLLLVFQGLMVITAVAIAVSTRLGQIMTLLACLAVFFLGLTSDYFFGTRVSAEGLNVWEVLYRVIPNIQFFWPADALTQEVDFSAGYVFSVTAYCALLVMALLGLAIGLFQTREVG